MRRLVLDPRNNGGLNLSAFERRQFQPPEGGGIFDFVRRGGKMDNRLPRNSVMPHIVEQNFLALHDWLVVMAQLFPGDTSHLENVHEVGFINKLDQHFEFVEVEILNGELVKQRVRTQQLFAADVDAVFRNLVSVAQGTLAGSEFNLRGKSLLRTR